MVSKNDLAKLLIARIFTGLMLLVLSACQFSDNKTQTVTFIHLNDLHAHLTPHRDYIAVKGEVVLKELGGIARIATTIKEIRAENPDSILMNIGDTFHGGVEALFTQGNAIAPAINALGVDIGVPGNWDFAYGPEVTRARFDSEGSFQLPNSQQISGPVYPNLAANVKYTSAAIRNREFLPPTLLKEIGHTKVGFIGLTSDIVAKMHPLLAAGFEFVEGESGYLALLTEHAKKLREQGAQIVVVMSELGIQKDFHLANLLAPNLIDVFFSAHTHELTREALLSESGALVVEAGSDIYLGRMDIKMREGKVYAREWQILEIDSGVHEDAEMRSMVKNIREPFLKNDINMQINIGDSQLILNKPIDSVLGHVDHNVDRRHSLSNSFNQLFAAMLVESFSTDLAITPGFRFDAVIAPVASNYEDDALLSGDVTVEDVYRFFPVPFTLAKGQITGKQLKQIIESNLTAVFSKEIFQQSGGWFDGYAGLNLMLDLRKPDGQRILSMSYAQNGLAIMDEDRIKVAGCSRPYDRSAETTLCSYDGFESVSDLIKDDGSVWFASEFLSENIVNGHFNAISEFGNIATSSEYSFWPVAEFYQALQGFE